MASPPIGVKVCWWGLASHLQQYRFILQELQIFLYCSELNELFDLKVLSLFGMSLRSEGLLNVVKLKTTQLISTSLTAKIRKTMYCVARFSMIWLCVDETVLTAS